MERGTVVVELDLPQDLLEDAKSAGLLDSRRIEKWIQGELEKRERIDKFFALLDDLQKDGGLVSPEEIEEEIRLYREEKRLNTKSQA